MGKYTGEQHPKAASQTTNRKEPTKNPAIISVALNVNAEILQH